MLYTFKVFSGGMDSCLIRWDFSRGVIVETFDMNNALMGAEQQPPPLVNPAFVNSIDISSDGKTVVAGLGSGALQILTTAQSTKNERDKKVPRGGGKNKILTEWKKKRINAHPSPVIRVEFANFASQWLISGSSNCTIIVWDIDALVSSLLADSVDMSPMDFDESLQYQQLKFRPSNFGKLNWICTGDSHFGSNQIFIAGTPLSSQSATSSSLCAGIIESFDIQR